MAARSRIVFGTRVDRYIGWVFVWRILPGEPGVCTANVAKESGKRSLCHGAIMEYKKRPLQCIVAPQRPSICVASVVGETNRTDVHAN